MISCGVSLPHPINIKGHGRLKENPIESIKNISFIFLSLPYFSNLDMLFFSHLHGV